MELALTNLLIIVAAGFAAPFALGLAPGLRLPAVVLEIVLGIVLGPSVLGWVEVDAPVEVLALVGLALLLFLAGLEIDFGRLRGTVLRATALGFVLSFAIAVAVGVGLSAAGLVDDALFVAVLLTATSLGVLVPVLKDARQISSTFGQLVIAAASIADFGAVILLSLLFSREATSTTTQVILLVSLFVVAVAIGLALAGVEHSMRISDTIRRLQDTTAQIRVRGAFVLLVGFAALAGELGLELILGAFLAGALLTLIDRDEAMTHPLFRRKLEAVGFGVFIPVFFVTSGVRFDLDALLSSGSALATVPLFLAALLLARGVPALLYRPLIPRAQVGVAGLMQATSLPFIVAGTAIGLELGLISAASAAALIAAGLLSVLIFPALSLSLLRRPEGPTRVAAVDAHEGPVYVPEDEALYFTTTRPDVAIKRITFNGSTRVATVVERTRTANGMALAPDGRLLVCEQGTLEEPAAIALVDRMTGARATVVDSVGGRPLNSPNDVVVKSDGTIWFTDPSYGHLQGFRPPPALGDAVHRHDPATGETAIVAEGFDKPNGLAFAPDESVLYVGDSGAPHHVLAFDVVDGRALGRSRVLAVIEPGYPDGLKVDAAGRVYVTSAAGVQVFAPSGERLAVIRVPGVPVNFAFGPGGVLFITTDDAVWTAAVPTFEGETT